MKPPISTGRNQPPSAAIDDNSSRIGAYYLGNEHRLIHRHTETVDLQSDRGAKWGLRINFELPTAEDARCGVHNKEALFLFPLLFLRKAEGRTGFKAQDEQRAEITFPNRETSDHVSAVAAAGAATRLLDEARKNDRSLPELPLESLEYVFECIAKWPAYAASVSLNHLLNNLDERIVEVWEEGHLTDDLKMLVDHSLVWVPLRGLPGERRTIDIRHDLELARRPLVRWHFGELSAPRFPRLHWRRARRQQDPDQVLNTGKAIYGRSAWRISLSVLGERLAQPLGTMPIEFDVPTIYARRCGSYHFELNCPPGLSPRGIKVALDYKDGEKEDVPGRTTIGERAAHVYLPTKRSLDDVVLRATVGLGAGAFPMLWVLMGVITTAMLWSLVAFNPNWLVAGDNKNHNEIAAAVLLIVPALLGATVAAEENAVSSMINGTRLLVLITGLCCAAATAVLIKVEPFSTKPQAAWAVCAAIATAATIPMATGWLLSKRAVWRSLKALNSTARQYLALIVQTGLAVLLAWLLSDAGGDTALRAGLASCLLLLTVTLVLLASNRLAVEMNSSRRFVSVGAILVAIGCLVLGCVELQRIFAPNATWQPDVESIERWLLLLAPTTGILLWAVTRIFGPGDEELSISPEVGAALVSGERIRELRRLRELDPSGEEDDQKWLPLLGPARRALDRVRQ